MHQKIKSAIESDDVFNKLSSAYLSPNATLQKKIMNCSKFSLAPSQLYKTRLSPMLVNENHNKVTRILKQMHERIDNKELANSDQLGAKQSL